jgi:UrcA family protein
MRNRKTAFGIASAFIVGVFAATFATGAVAAADNSKIVVSYADLNLSAVEGIETLYQRIQSAAQVVCSGLGGRTLQEHSKFDSCKLSAISNAVSDVAVPALSEYYNTHAGIQRDSPAGRKEVTVAKHDNGHPRSLCLASASI